MRTLKVSEMRPGGIYVDPLCGIRVRVELIVPGEPAQPAPTPGELPWWVRLLTPLLGDPPGREATEAYAECHYFNTVTGAFVSVDYVDDELAECELSVQNYILEGAFTEFGARNKKSNLEP